jgi:two-component system OmpR family sensor kinase
MTDKPIRRWLGPLIVILIGILVAVTARLNWIPNYLFKGNLYFDFSVLLVACTVLAGLAWSIVIIVQGVIRRKVAQATSSEKDAQSRERQRFLHRLDHEMKNPLTTIRLGIANLQEGSSLDDDMRRSLERISLQAQRLQALVENLRRLSDMDEKSLDRSQVDLAEVLEDAIEIAREAQEGAAGQVNLNIQQVPWPLSPIDGDRDLLMVAFRNLIENALKFSGTAGRVEVRASEDGHNVLVEIDDNGRGIPAQDQPYVFDELYRAENARDLPGSGLGLALVRRVVELHGGSMSINSRPGQGTMVRVQLPIHS